MFVKVVFDKNFREKRKSAALHEFITGNDNFAYRSRVSHPFANAVQYHVFDCVIRHLYATQEYFAWNSTEMEEAQIVSICA